jgi:hypothetical protein
MGKGKYKEKVRSAVRTAVGAAQPSSKKQRLQQQQRDGGNIGDKGRHNQKSSVSTSQMRSITDSTLSAESRLSDLQQRFKKKLEGARFRSINERLYSCKGEEAFSEFQTDPSLFDAVGILGLAICLL